MENIPHEVSVSLEALMSLLTTGTDVHVLSMDSQSIAVPTVSSSSSSSNAGGGFEIRRAARRLDRALQSLETALEQCAEAGQDMTVGPLLQTDLVAILTSLAQALDAQPSVDWRSHDVLQLYEDLALTACRILVMNESFILQEHEQLDALVDRIALLLIQQDEQANASDRVLNGLVFCVNRHLVHVEEAITEHSVLFPLLQGLETIQLLKIVIQKCSQEMTRRWYPHEQDDRIELWTFCTYLLKHLAGCCGDNDMHGWLQHRFVEDEEARARYTSPQVLQRDVDGFLDSCRAFGVDLIEIVLEILDQASIETSVSHHAHEAIQHTSLVYTTVHVIENGLEVDLPFPMLRSLFTAYASFVAILTHKLVEQEGNVTKMVACDVLVDLANFVLKNPQSRSSGVCDSTMETAVSITLLCALDSCGIKEELSPILEYMRDQGQATAEWPANKKSRRDEQQDGDSTTHKNVPFTDMLQTSIMASLMLPSSSMDATQPKDSVARLVQSFPSQAATDPWHSLVARKVKESFGVDPMRNSPNGDTNNLSWCDRALESYVVDHEKKPQTAAQPLAETGELNGTNGNN